MKVKYLVFKTGSQWAIHYAGKDYPYDSHSQAVCAAVKAASKADDSGFDAEVSVQGIDGKWRTEWPIR